MQRITMAMFVLMMCAANVATAQTTRPRPPREPITTTTRVYDIRDLLLSIDDYPFNGQLGAPREPSPVVVENDGGGGGGQNLFGGEKKPTQPRTRAQRVEDVTKLVTETIAPDSWREAGGTFGALREIAGMLVVTQTEENQRMIESLLGQLRDQKLATVRVQAQWILLQPQELSAMMQQAQKQDAAASKSPLAVLDPAALAKLGDKTVRYRAEISCFNAQTVSVFSGRSRTAVIGAQPVVAQGAVAMGPQVKQVLLGAMLEVTPTIIQGNEQTAVVDVKTQVADWTDAEAAEAPTTQISSPDRGARLLTGPPAVIDKLNILGQELRTTAQIPMNKPILIGGMTLEPAINLPGGPQLYLVLEVCTAR